MVLRSTLSRTKKYADVQHPCGHPHGFADDDGSAECDAAGEADAGIFEPCSSAYTSVAQVHRSS